MIRAVAALVGGGLLLAGCGQQEAPPPASRSAASANAPHALPACETAQLELAVIDVRIAAGTVIADFALKNTSPATCQLQGFVSVQMASHGLPITTNSTNDLTAPAQAVVLGGGGGQGSFLVTWAARCPPSLANTPTEWRVTPPGQRSALTVSVQSQNGAPVPVCGNSLRVGPVRP